MRPLVGLGSDFELDLETHTLRRAGRVLKLERIPMEILVLLVLQAGQVVTREQIIERVWGKGAFLDSDNSINGAIRKVRFVLKDVADQPRFIQTITGSGYRFIAPVVDRGGNGAAAETGGVETADAPPAAAQVPPVREVSRRWFVAAGAALAVAGLMAGWLFWSKPQPQPGERLMIAVLPFENLTGDTTQEYFSDGMTEEVIAQLGQIDPRRLGVIARTSVMPFKHNRQELDEIRRKLGVQYVLEGSVRRDAGRVRIAVQLIQLADQTHVWARQYDREPLDVLRLQAEISHAVAEEIELTFGGGRSVGRRAAPLSPEAFDAYDLYLKGRYYWNKRSADAFTQAAGHFQQALAKDPNYARAYAGLADTYALMGTYGLAPADEVMPKARAAAVRALEIDEALGEAHASLALIMQMYEWDWRGAEREFRRAIELDSNYVTARHWYAEHLAFMGRFDEALAQSARARQLDPLSLIIAADHAAILYFSRQYDCAIQQFRAVLAVEPDFGRAQMIVAAYLQHGQLDEALAHIQNWQKSDPGPWPWAWAAYLHGRAGRIADARRALQEMEKSNQRAKLDLAWLSATALSGMGEKDDVLAWLDRARMERSSLVLTLKVDPIFDLVRGDPRFDKLLQRVGLTQESPHRSR